MYLHRDYKNILHSTYLGKNFNSIAQVFHSRVHSRIKIYHPSIVKGLQNNKNTPNNNQIYIYSIYFIFEFKKSVNIYTSIKLFLHVTTVTQYIKE